MTQIPVPAMVFGAIDVISELRPHLAGGKKELNPILLTLSIATIVAESDINLPQKAIKTHSNALLK